MTDGKVRRSANPLVNEQVPMNVHGTIMKIPFFDLSRQSVLRRQIRKPRHVEPRGSRLPCHGTLAVGTNESTSRKNRLQEHLLQSGSEIRRFVESPG